MLEKSDLRVNKIVFDFEMHSLVIEVEYDLIEDGSILSTVKDTAYIRKRIRKVGFLDDLAKIFPNIGTNDIIALMKERVKKAYPILKQRIINNQIEDDMTDLE